MPIHFSQLSDEKQTLLRLCQLVNFGSIKELEFRDGEPVFSPTPTFLFDFKLNAECGPRPEFRKDDYALGAEALRLFALFTRLKNGSINTLEIRHGIPVRLVLDATAVEVA